MKLSHRFIVWGSIGFGLGVIEGVIIAALTAGAPTPDGGLYLCADELIARMGSPLAAFILQTVITGIYGALAMGGAVVYSIESWGLLKCTVSHYLALTVGLYVMAKICCWNFDMWMFGVSTVVYFLIWLCFYISYRIQLKKINKELGELKEKNGQ